MPKIEWVPEWYFLRLEAGGEIELNNEGESVALVTHAPDRMLTPEECWSLGARLQKFAMATGYTKDEGSADA